MTENLSSQDIYLLLCNFQVSLLAVLGEVNGAQGSQWRALIREVCGGGWVGAGLGAVCLTRTPKRSAGETGLYPHFSPIPTPVFHSSYHIEQHLLEL